MRPDTSVGVALAPVRTPARRTTTVATSVVAFVAVVALGWSLLASFADRVRPEAVSGSGADGAEAQESGLPPVLPPSLPSVLSATDADFGGSTWFVLDRRARRIHRFSETGALLGHFARQGDGPGELSSPTALAVHRDRVAVADRGFVRLYDFAGTHVADQRHAIDGCFAPRIANLDSVSLGLLILVQCTNPVRGMNAMAFLARDDGGVRMRASVAPPGRGIVADLGFQPVMSAHPAGFVFGNADAECLGVYDLTARRTGRECHGWLKRTPLSKREADALKEQIMPAARAVGARVIVPLRLPPFERVFDLPDGRLAYRVPVPVGEGEEGTGDDHIFRLVTQGEAGGEQALPTPAASALFVSGNSVLAAWDAPDGVRIATYRLGVS